MNLPRFFTGCCAVLLACSAAPRTRAQVIYDNIGNGSPYVATFGLSVGPTQELATQFTAGQSLFLDYAELRLWRFGSSSEFVEVALLTNSGSNTPGSILEFTTVSVPLVTPANSTVPIARAEFSNTTFLTLGTTYWLAVTPLGSNVNAAWDMSGTPLGHVVADDLPGFDDPWSHDETRTEGAMRVFGASPTAVPEPSTYGFLASALLIGAVALRSRRK